MSRATSFSRRDFLKYAALIGASVLGGAALSGCSEGRVAASTSASAASTGAASAASASATASSASTSASASQSGESATDTLVLYFSRAGENYNVGYVEEGNTAILAKMIAEKTGADTFEIAPAEPYPPDYEECCDVALDEQKSGARPAYVGDIDIAPYKTVYLGYPIWWGDLPMCVCTFLEAHDWSGKEIRPFCTHEGSGLTGTEGKIRSSCGGATVREGLSMTGQKAQNSRTEAEAAVDAWLG